ncbi:MAG TPA: plastocyanin/azurin family copper-binding protein [Candidatus Tumulicola sp.]|jgi:plastocyanin
MFNRRVAFSAVLIGAVLVACSSRGGGILPQQNGQVALPSIASDLIVTANVPAHTIGEELPSEGVGTYSSPFWKATLGGYTQMKYAQSLGFPPGTKITIRNLSKKTPHTLNVVAAIKGPPANFPKNPSLKTQKHGGSVLEAGYASGVIQPGKSVTVTLSKAGTYLIGCAFHYGEGMHDVLVVSRKAKPGQQGTPPPHGGGGSPPPTTGPSPTGY